MGGGGIIHKLLFVVLSSLSISFSGTSNAQAESLNGSNSFSNAFNKLTSSVEEKAQDFRQLSSQDGVFPEIHLYVESCEQYPYYGTHSNGPQNLRKDFMQLIAKSRQCLLQKNEGRQLPSYVANKITELYHLLKAPKEKTVACTYGEYNSFYAVSKSGLNPKDKGPIGVFLDMPKAPSIFMDTNCMAGNFPLNIDSDDVKNFKQFYGNKLNGVEILPGTKNPMISGIENSASLLFHEMLHWVGLNHSQKDYPDLVYLSQICCFDHPSIAPEQQKLACEILYNDNYWSGSKEQRKNNMAKNSITQQQKQLIQLYHQ